MGIHGHVIYYGMLLGEACTGMGKVKHGRSCSARIYFSKVELQPNLAESLDMHIVLLSLPNLEAGKLGFGSL